jgi:hypothetical protein
MKIEPSYDHKGKFDIFLSGEYCESATLTIREIFELRELIDQFVFSHIAALITANPEAKS